MGGRGGAVDKRMATRPGCTLTAVGTTRWAPLRQGEPPGLAAYFSHMTDPTFFKERSQINNTQAASQINRIDLWKYVLMWEQHKHPFAIMPKNVLSFAKFKATDDKIKLRRLSPPSRSVPYCWKSGNDPIFPCRCQTRRLLFLLLSTCGC